MDLVLIAALVLDFLSIHPFQDGNGRVARLITTQELLRHGYGIARYVSLEQRVRDYVLAEAPAQFRAVEIGAAFPDVSPATVRNALNALRDDGLLTPTRGRAAVWTRATD
jgi:Fic family protein